MVEWSQFWKDFSDAHKEMTAIIGVDNADKLLLGDVLGTLKLFYDMNKREHASQQQTLDTSDPDAPTAKQIAFAKKLGIRGADEMGKDEIAGHIERALAARR